MWHHPVTKFTVCGGTNCQSLAIHRDALRNETLWGRLPDVALYPRWHVDGQHDPQKQQHAKMSINNITPMT